jgi:DNA polymerase III delta subunit
MKTYKTTIWPLVLLYVIGIFGLALIAYSATNNLLHVAKAIGLFASVPTLAVILFGWLTYEEIDNNKIIHVVWALFRRIVDIRDISRISEEGTYYMMQSMIKSIYLYYTNRNGKERFLHLSMALYNEKTLQRLMKDLLEINPNIKLDKGAERLLKTGKIK